MTPTDLMVKLKELEFRCRRAKASVAAPPAVYQKFQELRNEMADWALECIVEDRRDDHEEKRPRNQSDR